MRRRTHATLAFSLWLPCRRAGLPIKIFKSNIGGLVPSEARQHQFRGFRGVHCNAISAIMMLYKANVIPKTQRKYTKQACLTHGFAAADHTSALHGEQSRPP